MLSFEEIEDCFPNGAVSLPDGWIGVTAQWMHDFAHAIEAECAVPEVIGLYEKALKASWPNGATGDAFDYWNKARYLLAATTQLAPKPAQASPIDLMECLQDRPVEPSKAVQGKCVVQAPMV